MTCIAKGVVTKKALKAAALRYNETRENPNDISFIDPAIAGPIANGQFFGFDFTAANALDFTCTNHPKRSWFARVQSVGGKVKVS
jgi:hypothetical protein